MNCFKVRNESDVSVCGDTKVKRWAGGKRFHGWVCVIEGWSVFEMEVGEKTQAMTFRQEQPTNCEDQPGGSPGSWRSPSTREAMRT